MAMGKRRERQEALFILAGELPRSPGHPFYRKLNQLLAEAEFDHWIERRCQPYYTTDEQRGQPSIPPGVYFRMLLVGYFENIRSQRGVAWRCADSLSLRQFLGIPIDKATPDHSTLTNTRNRLPEKVFDEVFQFVLAIAANKKLLSGKTVGVDSTTLEADAAMKSIVRRDGNAENSGEDWKQYVTRLMHEDGAIEADEQPSDEDVRRYDKQRKNKRVSSDEWTSPTDPDSRIAKMKDGTRCEACTRDAPGVQGGARRRFGKRSAAGGGDSPCRSYGHGNAGGQRPASAGELASGRQRSANRGSGGRQRYHAAHTLEQCADLGLRTYIPEPRRKHRSRWAGKPPEHRRAVLANRRRVKRAKSKHLQRRRSELCERTCAHLCDSGGTRRCRVKGIAKLSKCYRIAAAAHNLGRIMLKLFGIGEPRTLQGGIGLAALVHLAIAVWKAVANALTTSVRRFLIPLVHLPT